MKLEVGKLYKMRGPSEFAWARVDAIRVDVCLPGEQVCLSCWHPAELAYYPATCTITGAANPYDAMDHARDLVAEYNVPAFRATQQDVGRLVRLRDGSITMIIMYSHGKMPISSGAGYHRIDGRRSHEAEYTEDIVGFVEAPDDDTES